MARKTIDHMQSLLTDNYENLEYWEPYLDSDEKDFDGHATNNLFKSNLKIAVYEYIINKNIEIFREHLLKAIQYGLYNIRKYDQGLPIRNSHVSYARREVGSINLLNYALVLGSPKLVNIVAAEVKFRKNPEESKGKFLPIMHVYSELALGHVQSASDFLLQARNNPILGVECGVHDPYFFVFDIILRKKKYSEKEIIHLFNKAYKVFIKNKYCTWASTVYEDLNLEAIAYLNLLRFYGFEVNIPQDILIPSELLVDPSVAPYRHLMFEI